MLQLHLPDFATAPLPTDPADPAAAAALPGDEILREAVWIDLFHPSAVELQAVERALALELPSLATITEIEPSSRISRQGSTLVMNLQLVAGIDSGVPLATHVSLILAPRQLITIRNSEPHAFHMLRQSCEQHAPGPGGGRLLLRLLEQIADRSADILERMGAEIDSLSERTFGFREAESMRVSTSELQQILRGIGRVQFVLNKVYESLSTQARVAGFLIAEQDSDDEDKSRHRFPAKARPTLDALARDLASLSTNCAFLIESGNFLLDAAVGRISIEQNAIMSVFSVAAVIFLPPTLIGTIYGMNFHNMPELALPYAYPLTLAAMLLSAVLPYLWFKKKGWL